MAVRKQPVYKLYTELLYYKPKIWRRLLVIPNIKMSRLAYTIMSLYEMEGNHLFEFYSEEKDEHYIVNFDNEFKYNDVDATSVILKKVMDTEKQKIIFTYDFGDSWEVSVKLEEIIKDSEFSAKDLPKVLSGKGHGIIEDCGGVSGLCEIAEAFQQKTGEQYEEYCEWLGTDELDLLTFDKEKANEDLKHKINFLRSIYERRYYWSVDS